MTTNYRQKLEKWLRIGIVPSVPHDAEDEEPCTPAACVLMKPDAPHPDWEEMAAATGWMMKSPDAPREVAELVVKILRETGKSEVEFNVEFEKRIEEYRVPCVGVDGLHEALDHRRDVNLCCSLEAAASFLHHWAVA